MNLTFINDENWGEQRRRYFRKTVLLAIAFAVGCGFLFDLVFRMVVFRLFPLSLAMPVHYCWEGVSRGMASGFWLHLAIWWVWRRPNQSSIWTLLMVGSLSLLPNVLQLANWIVFHEWYEANLPGGLQPLALTGLSAIGNLMRIPWCVVTLWLLSPLVSMRLQDRNHLSPINWMKSRRWSIRGLMLLTFLVAAEIAVRETTNRIMMEHFTGTGVRFDSGNTMWLMLLAQVWQALRVGVIVLAGWSVSQSTSEGKGGSRSQKRLRILLLAFAILAAFLANMQYQILYTGMLGDFYFWSNHVLTAFMRQVFDFLAVYWVSCWFFRRWQQAGYQINGWLIGRGTW